MAEGARAPQNLNPFRYAHEHRDEIVWMSQNTNHLPTSPKIREAMIDAIEQHDYEYYPESPGLRGLPELVLDDVDLDPADGWRAHITEGALEALYVLNRALLEKGDEVIASDPSFLPIHHQIRLGGAKPVELPIYQDPWKLTIEQVKEAINDRTRMLLLIDPINPIGTQYTKDEVRAFAELANDHDLLLVHDITYHDFAFDPALATTWAPERTLVPYSFSKNCGFAGLRVGSLMAQESLLERVKPAYVNGLGTNIVAQRAAKAALESKPEWIGRVVGTSRDNQRKIKECVDQIDGCFIPVSPSSTNTLVIDVSERGLDPDEVERKLLFDHGVFVRGGPYLSKRFGSRFLRVSFSVPPDGVARFTSAFPKVVEALS